MELQVDIWAGCNVGFQCTLNSIVYASTILFDFFLTFSPQFYTIIKTNKIKTTENIKIHVQKSNLVIEYNWTFMITLYPVIYRAIFLSSWVERGQQERRV